MLKQHIDFFSNNTIAFFVIKTKFCAINKDFVNATKSFSKTNYLCSHNKMFLYFFWFLHIILRYNRQVLLHQAVSSGLEQARALISWTGQELGQIWSSLILLEVFTLNGLVRDFVDFCDRSSQILG